MRIGTVILVGVVLALPAGARAQDARAVKKIEELHRLALADLDIDDAAGAKQQLAAALELVRSAKLDAHPVAARTRFYLGLLDGSVDEVKAALALDPTLVVPPALASPERGKLVEQAKVALAAKAAPPPAAAGPVVGIQHLPVDSAKEGEPIAIEARVGVDVKARRVNLFYRPAGHKAFAVVEMKKASAESWKGGIPAAATAADAVAYYIDVRNARAKVVAAKGGARAPFVITIVRKEAPAAKVPLDAENPLENLKK